MYVTRAGTVFHPAWCSTVAAKWDTNPKGLIVIAEDTVGARKACQNCDFPLTT